MAIIYTAFSCPIGMISNLTDEDIKKIATNDWIVEIITDEREIFGESWSSAEKIIADVLKEVRSSSQISLPPELNYLSGYIINAVCNNYATLIEFGSDMRADSRTVDSAEISILIKNAEAEKVWLAQNIDMETRTGNFLKNYRLWKKFHKTTHYHI